MYFAAHIAVQGGGEAPTVSARADGAINSRLDSECFAGAQFQDDGDEFEYAASGALTLMTTWLDTGAAEDVWVERTITGGSPGTWNNLDPGTGRHQLSTTRSFRIRRAASGFHTVIGFFEFFDAASGGNNLQTTSTVTWSAENEFDPCPICCFTPETLITMVNGLLMPIGKVRKGDMIMVFDNDTSSMVPEAVTGIITRANRNMFRIHFNDGSFLDASEDHPLDIEGKGPASLNPIIEYKDIGLPDTLKVGDKISTLPGSHKIIEKIEPIIFRGTVFTLENTLFYAGGSLVY